MHTIPNDLNRISKCPMMTKDKLRKKIRGSYDSLVTENKNIVVAKWNDNNIVTIASNAVPVLPLQRAKRFSKQSENTSMCHSHIFSKSTIQE